MSDREENKESKRRHSKSQKPRPQYHYFYGSTVDVVEDDPSTGRRVNGARLRPNISVNSVESDSLVGESLLLTDNEEDFPRKRYETDYQQLLLSGENGGLLPLSEHPEDDETRSCCWWNQQCRNPFESHVTFIWIGAILFLLFLTLLVAPDGQLFGPAPTTSTASNPTKQAEITARQFKIPFREVNRLDYGDATAKFLDTDLFAPSLVRPTGRRGGPAKDVSTPQQGNNGVTILRDFIFPFPTGAFWTNLVMRQTDGDGFSYPVAVYPYAYKWSTTFLVVSYPALHRQQDAKSIHDYFFPDLRFGEDEGITKRYISNFDQLSVTVKFEGQKGTSWESYLVQGSPYVTIKYTNARPVIKALSIFSDVLCPQDNGKSLSFSVCSSNNNTPEQEDHKKTALRGVQFVIETQEGIQWMMFSSELASLEVDTRSKTTIVVSAENGKAFTGVLRFAILPPRSSSNDNRKSTPADEIWRSTGIQRLIYHAGIYPTTGKMDWTVKSTADVETLTSPGASTPLRDEKRVATIKFKFQTGSFSRTSATPNPLLMLALPHHAQSLPSAAKLDSDMFDLVFKCIKGTMVPITGETWSYDELLPSLGFEGDAGSNNLDLFLDPAVRSALLGSLAIDIELALPTKSEGVYGFGKQAARLAQLVHIADRMTPGNRTIDSITEQSLPVLLRGAVQVLKDALSDFLRGNVSDKLVFDANLGGLVSEDGLRDPNADFGSGRYNDHHFHYGYILYACAILGRLNHEFVESFGSAVDAIMYDIAYNGNFDSSPCETVFFPGSRHKSWFDGHSFASGCFPFGNGKSQESSSEAVNAYYGAYLWSLVRNGAPLHSPNLDQSTQTDFLRLLLATEIRGARTYWHMIPSSGNTTNPTLNIYDSVFSENYMIGNLGMLDAICSTWFGTSELYVHMINFLPVTSIAGDLFDQKYASLEYRDVLSKIDAEMAWKGYVVADRAISDPNGAWNEAIRLDQRLLDSGTSKTQILYWISTRFGFNVFAVDTNSTSGGAAGLNDTLVSERSCASVTACASLNLRGDCCPSLDGRMLGCCTSNGT